MIQKNGRTRRSEELAEEEKEQEEEEKGAEKGEGDKEDEEEKSAEKGEEDIEDEEEDEEERMEREEETMNNIILWSKSYELTLSSSEKKKCPSLFNGVNLYYFMPTE